MEIQISNLKYSWNHKDTTLSIPELNINKGELVFIQGPSGSGKTTFLNLLGGMLKPNEGEIRIHKTKISQLKKSKLDKFRADHMGFIFQQFNLLPFIGIIENTILGCQFSQVREKRVKSKYRSLNNAAFNTLSTLGLEKEAMANKAVSKLSTGQQQRVAAARSLLGEPDLIIADEPTSSLDKESRDVFISLLIDQCKRYGSTLIFVSHDSSLKKNFNKAFTLSPNKNGYQIC